MSEDYYRIVLFLGSFVLIAAAAWAYGGLWACVGATGVFWWISVLRK